MLGDVVVGAYFGIGEVARALGITKQAVSAAVLDGRGCRGYEFVVEKNDGEAPMKNLEDIRGKRGKKKKMPDIVFEESDIYQKVVEGSN